MLTVARATKSPRTILSSGVALIRVPSIWSVSAGLECEGKTWGWVSVMISIFCKSSKTCNIITKQFPWLSGFQNGSQAQSPILHIQPLSKSHYPSITAAYLNVELKCSHCFLQNAVPLLLCQLHAVHPAAIQLFEQVRAGHAGKSKEGQALAVFQPHGLLGNPTQDLPSRQVAKVPGVSVGNQEFWVLFTNLGGKNINCYFSDQTAEILGLIAYNLMKHTCLSLWQYLLVAVGTTIFSLHSGPKKNSKSFSMASSLASSAGKYMGATPGWLEFLSISSSKAW